MRKIKVVALLLALVMLLAGCSLVSPDEERIAMQVVATVNGTQIYNYEVSEEDVAASVQQTLYYSGMSENDLTPEQLEETYNDHRTFLLEQLVNDEVMLQKAAELGFVLTEDEKAEIMVIAIDYFDSVRESIVAQIKAENAEAAGEDDSDILVYEPGDDIDALLEEQTTTDPAVLAEAEARLQALLEESRLSIDIYFDYLCEQELISKVRDYMTGQAEVTDQDAQTWYDQTLAIQQEEMDAEPGVFESLVYSKKIYTYVPGRIVAVREVILAFDEVQSSDVQALYTVDDMDAYDDMIDLILTSSGDHLTMAADIKARMQAGETIEDIVTELSVDAAYIAEPNTEKGYLIDSRTLAYSAEFVEAALGLQSIGDVSEVVVDYKGVHVLQLIKVYESGVVSFDDLKDSILTALLPSAEQDMYQQMLETWVEEADVKYFYNRLG
ncbi:MAG: hypothetical protein HN948_02615 [Clostridia bacterium]|jgi:hypothetical protein|nr:hypothetical protein [Clostridia bacterium]MBT7121884.1 hypothetical protein [Clostridia bacterium]